MMKFDQPVHFRGYVFRRAVLVDRPVRSQGVIGHRLIQTSFKPGLKGLAGRVEHNNCVLVPEKSRVKFLDATAWCTSPADFRRRSSWQFASTRPRASRASPGSTIKAPDTFLRRSFMATTCTS